MLSIVRMTKGSARYYRDLARYYRKGRGKGYHPNGSGPEFPPEAGGIGLTTTNCFSRWIGSAVEELGLHTHKEIVGTHFERLCAGYHPFSKEPLLQNSGSDNRCPGWDFTFSAPKSVSIVWAAADALLKRQIIAAHDLAVQSAVEQLEKDLCYSRVGKSGVNLHLKKVGVAVASWRDYVSRELEPQLHTHATLINLGLRDDGKYNALHSTIFFPWKKVLGAHYRCELARSLTQLGFRLEIDGTSFRIVGVPQPLCDANSTRRKQVVADCDQKGVYNAVAAAASAKETRKTKVSLPPLPVLEAQFREQCADQGFSAFHVEALREEPATTRPSLKELVSPALQTLFDDRNTAHVSYQKLLFAALVACAPFGYSAADVQTEVDLTLDLSTEIVPLSDGSFTTATQLNREYKLLQTHARLRRRSGARVSPRVLNRLLSQHRDLSGEQRQAVRDICSGTSSVRVLEGVAGAGKTRFVLSVVVEALRKSGYRVEAMAPTGVAASQLTNAIPGLRARTTTSGLANWSIPLSLRVANAASGLSKEALRHVPYMPRLPHSRLPNRNPLRFGPKTVLIVDESSMVSIDDFQQIMSAVEKQGGTVLFTGDPAQLKAVEALSPFAHFCKTENATKSSLLDTKRQKEEWQRRMVEAARAGDPRALELLRDNGCVHVSPTSENRVHSLIEDWTQFGIETPHKAAIIATTNEEVERINNECQRLRIAAGAIDRHTAVTIRDTSSGVTFTNTVHPGDRVLFTKAHRPSKMPPIENGFTGTALGIVGHKLHVRLDNSDTVVVSVRDFHHIRLGYCLTDYRSQGATFENVYVMPGQSRESLFVALSRGSERIKLFTSSDEVSDLENIRQSTLAHTLARCSDLRLAAELLPEGFELAPAGSKVAPVNNPPPPTSSRQCTDSDCEARHTARQQAIEPRVTASSLSDSSEASSFPVRDNAVPNAHGCAGAISLIAAAFTDVIPSPEDLRRTFLRPFAVALSLLKMAAFLVWPVKPVPLVKSLIPTPQAALKWLRLPFVLAVLAFKSVAFLTWPVNARPVFSWLLPSLQTTCKWLRLPFVLSTLLYQMAAFVVFPVAPKPILRLLSPVLLGLAAALVWAFDPRPLITRLFPSLQTPRGWLQLPVKSCMGLGRVAARVPYRSNLVPVLKYGVWPVEIAWKCVYVTISMSNSVLKLSTLLVCPVLAGTIFEWMSWIFEPPALLRAAELNLKQNISKSHFCRLCRGWIYVLLLSTLAYMLYCYWGRSAYMIYLRSLVTELAELSGRAVLAFGNWALAFLPYELCLAASMLFGMWALIRIRGFLFPPFEFDPRYTYYKPAKPFGAPPSMSTTYSAPTLTSQQPVATSTSANTNLAAGYQSPMSSASCPPPSPTPQKAFHTPGIGWTMSSQPPAGTGTSTTYTTVQTSTSVKWGND